MFGSSLPSALGWLVTTKVYSGTGADIVMESITLKAPHCVGHSARRAKGGNREAGTGCLCPIGGTSPSGVRKVEFKLLRLKFVSFFSSVYQPLPPFNVNSLPLNVSALRPARLP